jgi:hypothetical protein
MKQTYLFCTIIRDGMNLCFTNDITQNSIIKNVLNEVIEGVWSTYKRRELCLMNSLEV